LAQQQVLTNKYVQCPNNVNVLDPIILKGKRFFHSVTGEYVPIKGVAYYPRPNEGDLSITHSVDFFTDEFKDLWEADIPNFRALGVNTLRIYAVDPSKNHDAFMCALQEVGIYIMVELLADCEDCGIGPNEAPSCYPSSLKERGQWIINEFSKYSNTLVFSAGNEVTLYATDLLMELNAPCQKKFLRDMRNYVHTCSAIPASILPRKVPIGMATWDYQREREALYFNCRTDPDDVLENPEWYGLNTYQHCDPNAISVQDLVGWIILLENFTSFALPVPVLISEYGCRERFETIGLFEAQRNWLQVDALYSPAYLEQFAGGVAYEYSAEKAVADTSDQGNPWPYYGFMKLNYGMGYYQPIDCDHQTIPCEYVPYPEFDLLSEKLTTIDTSSFMPSMDDYTEDQITPPTCPSDVPPLSDFLWPSDDTPDLPCYLVPTSPPTLQPSMSPQPTTPPPPTPPPVPTVAPPPSSSGASTVGKLPLVPGMVPLLLAVMTIVNIGSVA
jgi:hypothetical protein